MNENLFDQYQDFVQKAQELTKALKDREADFTVLLQEHVELKTENNLLRNRIAELEGKTSLPSSKANLEKLYENNFHVCSMAYGSYRRDNEDCAFCLDVIYNSHEG